MLDKFLNALRESIITQALLTVGIWGVILFMVASGANPPDLLTQSGMIILGFYFGSKVSFQQGRQSVLNGLQKRVTDYALYQPLTDAEMESALAHVKEQEKKAGE